MNKNKGVKIEIGDEFSVITPITAPNKTKIHISHTFLSATFFNKTLIIYRVCGKHKQRQPEFICTEEDMKHYISLANGE